MRLPRLFRREPPPRIAATLYDAVVARGRMPHWYLAGGVPDTLDGRFDMIAAVLAMVMLRVEQDGAGAVPAASLAECFVDDMDGQLRQIDGEAATWPGTIPEAHRAGRTIRLVVEHHVRIAANLAAGGQQISRRIRLDIAPRRNCP